MNGMPQPQSRGTNTRFISSVIPEEDVPAAVYFHCATCGRLLPAYQMYSNDKLYLSVSKCVNCSRDDGDIIVLLEDL